MTQSNSLKQDVSHGFVACTPVERLPPVDIEVPSEIVTKNNVISPKSPAKDKGLQDTGSKKKNTST